MDGSHRRVVDAVGQRTSKVFAQREECTEVTTNPTSVTILPIYHKYGYMVGWVGLVGMVGTS